jgi:eukaryotic-like serine/threonine-protein kinase
MSASRKLARYAEVRQLGAGATGRVVLAEHRRSHRLVAIKHLSPACFADPVRRELFRRETKFLAALSDPNVVRLLEYVESREGAAIVTEAVEGPSLRRLLAASGPCPPEVALTLLHGALLGMASAHRRGIAHRDYKPENVLLDAAGHSRLADLGIAAPIGYGVPACGTPAYLAPEEWNGWPATKASDIYAVTVVFYECLTGRRPFSSATLRGLQALHETEPPRLAAVPPAVRPLVATGLAKLPALRYRNVQTYITALERLAPIGFGADWHERGMRDLAGEAGR